VGEVETPPDVVRPASVTDVSAPGFVDVWFDADRVGFDTLGTWLDGWELTRTDGDGESWRVAAPDGGEALVAQLVRVPGVRDARLALTRGTLPSGMVREGSERYGGLEHRWSIGPDGPREEAVGGATPPRPVLPTSLTGGARVCLLPAVQDMEVGISRGVGWERALSTAPNPAWAVVLDDYGPCRARGWLRLTPDADATSVRLGETMVANADDGWLQEKAIEWLQTPRPADDPGVMTTTEWLAASPTPMLVRAVRDVAAGPVQSELLRALAERDPEAALAIAGGSDSPVLRADAIGQDEDRRRAVVADPASPPSAVYAALAVWRPGPADAVETLDRFLRSPHPGVRARAWQARSDANAGLCRHRASVATTVEQLDEIYRDCIQADVRTEVFDRLRKADAARADGLLAQTLRAPETLSAGIAAVSAARRLARADLLEALVADRSVGRDVRAVALAELEKMGSARYAALQEAHGAYLGDAPPPAPVVSDGDEP